MPREQLWCKAGHYLDLITTDFYSMSGVTMEGKTCLVDGCAEVIVVRNFVSDSSTSRDYGYIVPQWTDEPNILQAAKLIRKATELRSAAEELEKQASSLKLGKIPNPDIDQTMISKSHPAYWEWYRTGAPDIDSLREKIGPEDNT